MEKTKLMKILTKMHKICEGVNNEIKQNEPENKLRYEVLQFSDIAKKGFSVHQIADFYNNNWLGNKDFMHIPDFEQVFNNCRQYPIIIAREEGNDDILAISTIKYDENTEEVIDPYFPEEDAKYFSVTGILVKRDTTHKGMGKKIYEIAVRGAYEYSKEYSGIRIMCVIDCRNSQSLRALAAAVDNINEKEIVGEGKKLPANVVGYYELKNMETGNLEEAPTLVLEVDLESQDKSLQVKPEELFEYEKNESEPLFDTIKSELERKFKKYGVSEPKIMEDPGCGMVYYYSLQGELEIGKTKIVPNGTAEGNDRKKVYDEKMHNFIGPIMSIAIEPGEGER